MSIKPKMGSRDMDKINGHQLSNSEAAIFEQKVDKPKVNMPSKFCLL